MLYRITPAGYKLIDEILDGKACLNSTEEEKETTHYMASALATILEYYPNGEFDYSPDSEDFRNITPLMKALLVRTGKIKWVGMERELLDCFVQANARERYQSKKWRSYRIGFDL